MTGTISGGDFTPAPGLTLSRMGYGAMQLAGPGVFGPPKDPDEAVAVLRTAVELGVTHIDTSDFYGPYVVNELIRKALYPYPDDLHLVTKVGARRDAMKQLADTSAPGDDAAYRGAFDKLIDVVRRLHDRGVFIVFGTDTGGSFTYHRELELYQKAGMTAPEILKRATLDSARYLGRDQRTGSIAKGKLADFFLVPGDPTRDLKAIKKIAMVVKDGTFYYPSEAYPKFGIVPFAPAPKVTLPAPPPPAAK